jgi:CxxC-x17-CxxC domain-containing protein
MEYKDKVLKCVDCGADFVFTAGEQLFYADKGFRNEPKRCKTCKTKKGSGGSGSVQASRGPSRAVTTTVCSQCGKETTVPFKVTQGRPVYCRDCFQQRRAAGVS